MGSSDHAQTSEAVVGWVGPFVLLSAIWGSSFALIELAIGGGVPPLWVASWRCLLGAVALVVICAVRGESVPRAISTWGHAAVTGALINAAPSVLYAVGQQQVSSVLAGAINATVPLMTLVFALVLVPGEQMSFRRARGLVTGFAGVLCLLAVWDGVATGTAAGALACLCATACLGAGFAYTRRFLAGRPDSALSLTTAQVAMATLQLFPFAMIAGGGLDWPGISVALALVLLGMVGTGCAFLLNFQVIRIAGPTIASTVTYVVPVWSTAIGAIALHEEVGWNTLLGAAVIVLGVSITRSRSSTSA